MIRKSYEIHILSCILGYAFNLVFNMYATNHVKFESKSICIHEFKEHVARYSNHQQKLTINALGNVPNFFYFVNSYNFLCFFYIFLLLYKGIHNKKEQLKYQKKIWIQISYFGQIWPLDPITKFSKVLNKNINPEKRI